MSIVLLWTLLCLALFFSCHQINCSSVDDDNLLSLFDDNNNNDLALQSPTPLFFDDSSTAADQTMFISADGTLPSDDEEGGYANLFSDAAALPPDSLDFLDDPTTILLADCGLTTTYQKNKNKKARSLHHRDSSSPSSSCPNSNTNAAPLPNLSLPSLDQAFPAAEDGDELPPPQQGKKKYTLEDFNADGNLYLWTGLGLKYAEYWLLCGLGKEKICSSGRQADAQLNSDGKTFTLKHAVSSRSCPFFFSCSFSLSLLKAWNHLC